MNTVAKTQAGRVIGKLLTLIGALVVSGPVMAVPLVPQVDFRDAAFAAYNGVHSFTSSVDGVGFKVEAFAADGSAAHLWWDEADGLGIRDVGDIDEIDVGETLRISFEMTIGLSEIYFSDLFAGENRLGVTYDEAGMFSIDGGPGTLFTAAELLSTPGNKANGEHLLTMNKIEPVNILEFTATGAFGYSDFSIIGFTDPPLVSSVVQVSEPGTLGLVGSGLLLFGLMRRRRR